jgi:hypothetical protein
MTPRTLLQRFEVEVPSHAQQDSSSSEGTIGIELSARYFERVVSPSPMSRLDMADRSKSLKTLGWCRLSDSNR